LLGLGDVGVRSDGFEIPSGRRWDGGFDSAVPPEIRSEELQELKF
jgi:hypothetical protein